jgi:hypothetical protein
VIDINYELYKVFYHVASTLNFSEALYFTIRSQPVYQNIREKTRSDTFYQKYKKSSTDSRRRNSYAAC